MSERPGAVLVAVKLPEMEEQEVQASLDELERLVSTLGYRTVARVTQARQSLAPGAVLGEGKLAELAALTGGTGHTGTTPPRAPDKARLRRMQEEQGEAEEPDAEDEGGDEPPGEKARGAIQLVAVDHDISPSQARNLERATGVAVLDRTGVIIEIFHHHARSREARLQVEIARLTYTAPRLRESPSGKERQRGRGAGEAALELDRRKIRDRIAELKEELASVQAMQGVRRAHRHDARRVALVGYTNAGKSSLMRALTGSEVHVEDKLFATLDTTVRALHPEVKPRILVSDTVGFIKKLPHDLVASFKSTLDEALEASHLLHVVDASDPSWPAQLQVTRDVLAEIGADTVPTTLVFNKRDRLDEEARGELARCFPDAWQVSAKDPEDIAVLRQRIIDLFESAYAEETVFVPYRAQRLVAGMHEAGRVLQETYGEEGVTVRWKAPAAEIARLHAALREQGEGGQGLPTPRRPRAARAASVGERKTW
jgi:GTP-binding protein HflX